MFLGPGGQEESNGTPHLTQAQSHAESQGGGVTNIYKDASAEGVASVTNDNQGVPSCQCSRTSALG